MKNQSQNQYSYNLYKLSQEYQEELKKDIVLIEKYLTDNNMNHQYFVNNIYEFILFEMWNIEGLSLSNIKEQINDYLKAHNESLKANPDSVYQPYTRLSAYDQR